MAADKEIILKLFKDFSTDYNASSISRKLNVSRVGAHKAMKALEKDQIIEGRTLGKARFYRLRLEDEYTTKNVETLLLEEAKRYIRWKEEFKELYPSVKIAVLFGSTIRNEAHANDIDVLLMYDADKEKIVQDFINAKNKILPRKIHAIKQTTADFKDNIIKKNKALLDAVRTGIVLHGYTMYVELIRDVTSRQ